MGKREIVLTVLIVMALIAGVIVGQFAIHAPATSQAETAEAARAAIASATEPLEKLGDLLFVRPLRMLVVPIVFVGVLVGVTSIGRPDRLGVLGGTTIGYYLLTMAASIVVGLTLVGIFQPGAGADTGAVDAQAERAFVEAGIESRIAERPENLADIFFQLADSLVPTNPVRAAAEGDTLPLVTLAIVLGLALVVIGDRGEPARAFFASLFEAMIRMVMWIIWLAIPGVFFVVAARVGQVGFSGFAGPLLGFSLVVLGGLLIHTLVTLPLVMFATTGRNPFRFMWQMRKPLLTAFATSSSAATLPITIEESIKSGGCSKRASNFVLPLGATVNMDGTALYIAVVTTFLFEIYGFDLNIAQYAIILFTATLAAVGTAAVPSASLVLMAIVITAVNNTIPALEPGKEPLPLHAIGIILGVDRLLDMCRTVMNVWGDSVGAKVLTRLAPDEVDGPPAEESG